MSYNIGQFISSQLNNYLSPIEGNDISITTQKVQSIESDSIIFGNCCINLIGDHVLNNKKCYYLKFKVQQQDTIQKFYLKLKNNQNSNSGTQLIEEFTVNTGTNDNYFEVIISPNNNGYNQIIWELQRITEDYSIINEDDSTINGRIMKITIQTYGQLRNLIPLLGLGGSSSLTKVGIQGPPSLLMCINREPIRIGRSGIYEINNGVNISFISFVPKENDNFIIDYEY